MDDLRRNLLILILVRLLLVSVVLGAAVFVLPQQLAFSKFFHSLVLTTYALTVVYSLLWKYSKRLDLLYNLQFYSDLVLISILISFSGGIHSLFTPLYVVIIVYASLMRDRGGGVLALTLSVISYTGIVHFGYWGMLSGKTDLEAYRSIVYRVALNLLGFVAVALLGIYLSERLQRARRELGITKGSLAALTALHENIVNSIRSGLVTLDPRGHLTSSNQVAQEIFAFSEQELLSQPLTKIFPEPILERILKSDFQVIARALRFECWVKNKYGKSLFLGMSCSPLLSQEKQKIGYVLSIQDLTEIKELEEEVQFREKMAAVGQMAAGLAHEIRNPLGSLSGSIQLLRSELDLTDEKARLIDIALKESERLNKIVQDFLVYAAGPQTPPVEPVDLPPLVQETVALFKNNPDFKEFHTVRIAASSTPVGCVGNPDQLRQVIWNILHNSIRAMPEGGTLTIELRRDDERALMSFRDEGVGMTLEQKKKLFQPFQSGFKKGVGLGMAIVYQIVQQHRGRIDVYSRREKGTVVDIWIPTSSESPEIPSDAAVIGRKV